VIVDDDVSEWLRADPARIPVWADRHRLYRDGEGEMLILIGTRVPSPGAPGGVAYAITGMVHESDTTDSSTRSLLWTPAEKLRVIDDVIAQFAQARASALH
jgi:hypothetical protein